MSSEIAIKVENLSKCYQIYATPRDRLKQFILPRVQRITGKQPRQYYREFWALKDISFEVKKGETVGIIGRNGSGKSTLLQLICGTLYPTSGLVQTHGRIAALLELGSGFNPEFTGRENVYMNAAVLGLSKEETDARFDDIAAFADIGEFIEQPVKTYSSGMYVRLAFAVQAMIDPDIFVVDEALAVGDEKFQKKCFSRLEELKSNGTSVLFVSHSPQSIIELCQNTLLIDHGTQIMFSSAPEAIRAYQLLLYAPADRQKRIIRHLQADGSLNDDQSNAPSPAFSPEGVTDNTSVTKNTLTADEQTIDVFDPELAPETTVAYPVQGATIDGIQIMNVKGQTVNILQPGHIYDFIIFGRFHSSFSGIFFAVHIKSVSGAVITGQRFPEEGQYIKNATAGESFEMCFKFRMDLLPGVYFVGGGIWSREEPSCAHRIIDALMFRVNPFDLSISFGYVNLLDATPTLKFTNTNVYR
ncbi:MAG: ABC transporter ATP-binding protein [Desulfobulbus oligotrophicus]|jgi:lipopolysaccharide transport system ATP-binding protein|nr:ABC transporter ATP-binding protein [Desulfobulbus oligotrophicus]